MGAATLASPTSAPAVAAHRAPTPAPGAVFVARGVTRIYGTGDVHVHALRGVDFDLYAGELLVLLGASGSGKSTLLNILGGLDTPTGGEVRFRDHDLAHADGDALTRYRREHVGFVVDDTKPREPGVVALVRELNPQ